MNNKPNTRKLSVRVTPQTAFNLERLAAISGLKTTGRVVDKLVREKMLSLKETEKITKKGERHND